MMMLLHLRLTMFSETPWLFQTIKLAFALSNEGYRAVTVNGDLYEPGAFESGYYRAPIDFSTIIPSENALKSLDEAVKALQTHLTQRGTDIIGIEEELEYTKIEITRLTRIHRYFRSRNNQGKTWR